MMNNPMYYPEVIQVVPGDRFEIFVYFNDGSIHLFDVEPLLKDPVFQAVSDEETFRRTLTVMGQTVAWDIQGNRDPHACIDLDPLELYRSTPVVAEPDWLREKT